MVQVRPAYNVSGYKECNDDIIYKEYEDENTTTNLVDTQGRVCSESQKHTDTFIALCISQENSLSALISRDISSHLICLEMYRDISISKANRLK